MLRSVPSRALAVAVVAASLALLAPACGQAQTPSLELVESWPAGTTLDNEDVRDAPEVWIELIDGAERSLDFEHFYASSHEDSALSDVVAAIERAAERGVRVRFIVDRKFYDMGNAALPDKLDAHAGIEVRILDLGPHTGGVQHAKFFVVDDEQAIFGSQNFDWRSLEHIHELGLLAGGGPIVTELRRVFAMDWALADGSSVEAARAAVEIAPPKPSGMTFAGEPVTVRAVTSPRPILPADSTWDLPVLVEMIDGAKERVRVQVMSYSITNYDRSAFTELDDALVRADDRGVDVELLIANWSKKPYKAEHLQEMQRRPRTSVRFVNIPEHESGFIPYARVIHAKYMTVDGRHSWLGTSNWQGDYFTASRNVGAVVEGEPVAARLDAVFEQLWTSSYAEEVDPTATYEAPRYKE